MKVLFEGINTYVSSDKLCAAVHEDEDEGWDAIFSQAKCPIHPVPVHEGKDEDWDKTFLQIKCPIRRILSPYT